MNLYPAIRPLLFQLSPEKAHDWTLQSLQYLPKILFPQPAIKPVKALGYTFSHPVGLAAGLDKNGDYLSGLDKIGFSFLEIGTVTPKAQAGNPLPRLFRLPEASALINRMGFNNHGVDALINNVQQAKYSGILGINIGKNKETPLDNAADDYTLCLQKVYLHASYITINISSPNTPDLRQLQQEDFFRHLLQTLQEEREKLIQHHQKKVPLVVKISPDEDEETVKKMVALVLHFGFEGMIATNTTASRETVKHLRYGLEAGGLSGAPLRKASLQTLRLLRSEAGDALTLIGAGGIDSPQVAREKLQAGADLLQVYTGLIYRGPALVREIVSAL